MAVVACGGIKPFKNVPISSAAPMLKLHMASITRTEIKGIFILQAP